LLTVPTFATSLRRRLCFNAVEASSPEPLWNRSLASRVVEDKHKDQARVGGEVDLWLTALEHQRHLEPSERKSAVDTLKGYKIINEGIFSLLLRGTRQRMWDSSRNSMTLTEKTAATDVDSENRYHFKF
jgi:hypothetical protein